MPLIKLFTLLFILNNVFNKYVSRKSPPKFGIPTFCLETERMVEKGLRDIIQKKEQLSQVKPLPSILNTRQRCMTVKPINTFPLAFLEAITLTEPAEISTTEVQDEPHLRINTG